MGVRGIQSESVAGLRQPLQCLFCNYNCASMVSASNTCLNSRNLAKLLKATHIAHVCPIEKFFVPSRDGISHSPREFSAPEDIMNGVNVLLHTLLKLDAMNLREPVSHRTIRIIFLP